MNGLDMKQAIHAHFTRNLGTNLAVSSKTVCITQSVIIHPVQLKLTRRIFVIALDHVETHGV